MRNKDHHFEVKLALALKHREAVTVPPQYDSPNGATFSSHGFIVFLQRVDKKGIRWKRSGWMLVKNLQQRIMAATLFLCNYIVHYL